MHPIFVSTVDSGTMENLCSQRILGKRRHVHKLRTYNLKPECIGALMPRAHVRSKKKEKKRKNSAILFKRFCQNFS